MSAQVYELKEKTPVLANLKNIRNRNIYSFHALPVSSYGHSDIVGNPLDKMEGCLESSITGELFDNFFFPQGVILDSQKLTSNIFNSDASFYITGGTSVANQIAITALYENGDKVLIDRNCHQSVHFHTQSIGAKVTYLSPDLATLGGEISAWSYEHLEHTLLSMQHNDNGCDMLILTAQSYEGVIYDIPEVLSRLLAAGVRTRKFFIDEAWGSLNYFSKDTLPFTAMNARGLFENYPDLEIVCTHSAHKSLFCLRQASVIHCQGSEMLVNKIETAKYRIHTTSPGYPVLASLDIAQATMSIYGEELAAYSRRLAKEFIAGVSSIPGLGEKAIYKRIFAGHWHIHYDPTKVMLNVSALGRGKKIKEQLAKKDVYVKRYLKNSLLFNFHIGINREAVTSLLSILRSIGRTVDNEPLLKGEISDKFIIPYPPGVPLVFPGEKINDEIRIKISECQKDGLLIIAA